MPEPYDVVIVGAGMAGGILAARIAEHGVNPRTGEKLRIALMDMGPYFKGDPRPGYGIPERRRTYANMPGQDDIEPIRSTPYGTICGIGGQSLHWGAQARLPIEEDHEQWMLETGVDWSYEKLTDARIEVTETFHILPTPEELMSPGARMFREAALKMGYQVRRFAMARLNCIWCDVCNGCKYDAKSGSLVRYIPIAERNGVEIMPDTMVEKVLIEKRGAGAVATGVVFTRAGKTQEARAAKVILSCSVEGTPLLLFKSGYGSRETVRGELIAENPNVGKNLDGYIHLAPVWAVFDEPVQRTDLRSVTSFYFLDRGPQGYLNIEIYDGFGGAGAPSSHALNELAPPFGREHKEFMKRSNYMGSVSPGVRRQNLVRGYVDFSSGVGIFKMDHPEIVKRGEEGRGIAIELLRKMGAKRLSDVTKPVELRGAITGHGYTGSCRAGSDRSNSVVNSDFECHDIENLLICDSSVEPSIPTFHNIGATTAFLACHAWRRIVAKHFSRV